MKKDFVRIIPETTERRIKQSEPPARFSFSKTSRNILALVFVFFMISALSFLLAKNFKESQAYDISKFSAGNIISDYTMSNIETMNEQQIQEFLTSKNSCNDRNIQRATNYPGYQYHIENSSVFLKKLLNITARNKLTPESAIKPVVIFRLTHRSSSS